MEVVKCNAMVPKVEVDWLQAAPWLPRLRLKSITIQTQFQEFTHFLGYSKSLAASADDKDQITHASHWATALVLIPDRSRRYS